MRTAYLSLPVEYSVSKTDPESLAVAMDRLMETALSTPGILDEYGPVQVGAFIVDAARMGGEVETIALLRAALEYVNSDDACSSNEYQECMTLRTEIEQRLQHYDDAHPHRCQDCGRQWPDSDIVPLAEVKNLLDRVSPGEPMPSGECPTCGALTQLVKHETAR